MKNLLLVLSFSCLFISCTDDNFSELYQNMSINFHDMPVYADSVSLTKVFVDFSKNLNPEIQVKFDISHGVIKLLPLNPNSVGNSTHTVTPFSDQYELYIFANTLIPKQEVYFSVTIDDFTKDTVIAFLPSYPEIIQSSAKFIKAQNDTNSELIFNLYKDEGKVSDGLQFKVNSIIVESDPTIGESILDFPDIVFSKNQMVKLPISFFSFKQSNLIELSLSIENEKGEQISEKVQLFTEE